MFYNENKEKHFYQIKNAKATVKQLWALTFIMVQAILRANPRL